MKRISKTSKNDTMLSMTPLKISNENDDFSSSFGIMSKLYSKPAKIVLSYCILILLLCSFLFFQPKIKASLFENNTADTFVEHFIQLPSEDMSKEWWKFREFFSPGYFTYNQEYLEPFSILQFKAVSEPVTPLFTFSSKNLFSEESLISFSHKDVLWQESLPGEMLLDTTDTKLSFEKDTGKYYLRMVRPLAEMKKVNGMINYEDPDELLTNQWWYSEAWFVAKP